MNHWQCSFTSREQPAREPMKGLFYLSGSNLEVSPKICKLLFFGSLLCTCVTFSSNLWMENIILSNV